MSLWDKYYTEPVEYEAFIERNDRGDPVFSPAATVKCRVEYARANIINAAGEEVVSEIRLYSSAGIPPGSRVTLGGRRWFIQSTAAMMGLSGTVDHYEMRL